MSAAKPSAAPASSSLVERSAHALTLALAMTVLLAPAAGASWPLAVLGLLLAAWPLALAERALAVRAAARTLPAGMQVLTREADARRAWRVLSWSSLAAGLLAMSLLALLSGALATQAVQTLADGHAGLLAGAQLWPLFTVLVLLTALLRPLGKAPVLVWLLPVLLLLALAVLPLLTGREALPLRSDLVLTPALPASAALLFGALALGGGVGAHWSLAPVAGARAGARQLAPALLLAVLVLAGLHAAAGLAAVLLGFIVSLLVVTALAQPLLAVARARGLNDWMALTLIFVPAVGISETIWFFGGSQAIGQVAGVLAVWMAFNLLVLSLFAGWVMKISHVRKALQLPSEAIYNVWRVAVRWAAPIVLLAGLAQCLRVWVPA